LVESEQAAQQAHSAATAANAALGIPALKLNDGRQSFRPNDGSRGQTAFPCELAVAATFDTALVRAFGEAMAEEFASRRERGLR
jgi:beta-glucosidase-like glycosyl hydrolase